MKKQNQSLRTLTLTAFAASAIILNSIAAENSIPLAKPDDKPADQTKKVKVFILMGQSNMVGMGDIGPETTNGTLGHLTKTLKKYPWLLDDASQWTARKDVFYYEIGRASCRERVYSSV